jgi:hypothetical protein
MQIAERVIQRECGVTRNVCVVDTLVVGFNGKHGIRHYEIYVAPMPDVCAPQVFLITTDRVTYERAHLALDTPRRFDVIWHRIETPFGFRYMVDQFDERT